MLCKNAFLHQMHFCTAKMHFGIKCICNILFSKGMHVMRTFCWCKNAFDAKMHLMRTFCFAEHFPLENVQRTFSKGKCSAKQNVTNAFDAKMHFGCAKMHLMQKCIFAQHHILLCKMFSITFCWCKNAFDAKMHFGCAKMHLMQKCIFAYILRSKMFSITFSKGKCSAKQNVTNAFDAKMHFGCAKMHLMQKCI